VADDGNNPKSDDCPCDCNKLVELMERVARLEEDNKWLKKQFEELNKQVGDINKRTWVILTSILTTMGGVIAILIRLAVVH